MLSSFARKGHEAVVWLAGLWWVLRQSWQTGGTQVPVPPPVVLPLPEAKIRRPRRSPSRSSESVVWHFKSTILDRLDEYFACLRRLRRYDPSAYRLFARVGFMISADRFVASADLPHRPAFGGVLFPEAAEGDRVHPSFVYFQKLHHPSRVQWSPGDTYRVTAVFDNRKKAARWQATLTHPVCCHVVITPDGQVTLLKELCATTQRISPRKGRRRLQTFRLSVQHWAYPSWTYYLAEDKGQTPEQAVATVFRMTVGTYAACLDRVVIRAHRQQMCAAFGIDLPRARHFFADRALDAPAKDGKRKRIFHSVRPHDREVATGVVPVRGHYRGIRDFFWNGCRIHIVFPRREQVLRTFAAAGSYAEDLTERQRVGAVPDSEAGRRIAERLEE